MRDDVYRVAQRYAQHHGASTYGDGRDLALNSPHTGQRKERTEERWYDDKGYRAAVSKREEDDQQYDNQCNTARDCRVPLYLSCVIYRNDGASDNIKRHALRLGTHLGMLKAVYEGIIRARVAHAVGGLNEDEHRCEVGRKEPTLVYLILHVGCEVLELLE